MEQLAVEQLGTVLGVALVVKLVAIPVTKLFWKSISGPGTLKFALLEGIALSLCYEFGRFGMDLSLPVTTVAILRGLMGGWAAVGIQDTVSAIRRPDSL